MHNLQKYVNALYIATAAILWFIARYYIEVAIGTFGLTVKLGGGVEVLRDGFPLVVGIATYFLLRTNQTSHTFVSDAVSELSKVSWPSKKETQLGTVVVILTVLIAGLILGLIDLGFMNLVKTVINI